MDIPPTGVRVIMERGITGGVESVRAVGDESFCVLQPDTLMFDCTERYRSIFLSV